MWRENGSLVLIFANGTKQSVNLAWRLNLGKAHYIFVWTESERLDRKVSIFQILQVNHAGYHVTDVASATEWCELIHRFKAQVKPHYHDEIYGMVLEDEKTILVLHGVYQVDEREFRLYEYEPDNAEEDDEMPGYLVYEAIVHHGRIEGALIEYDQVLIYRVLKTAEVLEDESELLASLGRQNSKPKEQILLEVEAALNQQWRNRIIGEC